MTSNSIHLKTDDTCYHCGESVPENTSYTVTIFDEEKPMCCLGCQAIAKAIVDSGLTSYYRYRTQSAIKQDLIPEELAHLTYYDDPSIQSEYVHQSSQGQEITLSVEGVVCAACAWLIENKLAHIDGIIRAQVNVTTSRLLLVWDSNKISLSQVLTQLAQLGYNATPFEANHQEQVFEQTIKQYLYRLGVAGLATMQVMMLAIALYFEVFSDLDAHFKNYFRIVSLIFATPVLLYSAQPFYANAWKNIKAQTLGMDVPVTIALLLAYFSSVYATFTQTGEVYFESISMFTFFLLLGRFLELRARRKAANISANLLKLVPSFAHLIDGTQCPTHQLNIGDKIRIKPGEHIPADGVIIQGETFIDESMLTGESLPVTKTVQEAVFAGTLNGNQAITIEVSTTKHNTLISKIIRIQDHAQLEKPKIAQQTDKIAQYFITCLLLIALITWLTWEQIAPNQALWVTLSVLVATCPCALSLATPTAITCAISNLRQMGLLLKKSDGLEALCQINQVILDKTGTLTTGEIKIVKTKCYAFSQDNQLDQTKAQTIQGSSDLNLSNQEAFFLNIAANLELNANHPIAFAFKNYQTSTLDISSLQNTIGAGIEGKIENQNWKIGRLDFCMPNSNQLAQKQTIYLSKNNRLVAHFEYADTIRPDAADFINKLHQDGLQVCILSGDTEETTKSIANLLNISEYQANLMPEDKLNYLKKQKQNTKNLMIGDGINDAPILSAAHLSIAMGAGTDVAKSSADIVLLTNQLIHILSGRKLALKARKIIRQNLSWALLYNILILPLAMTGHVPPYIAVIGMSISSIIVISNSLRLLKPIQ